MIQRILYARHFLASLGGYFRTPFPEPASPPFSER